MSRTRYKSTTLSFVRRVFLFLNIIAGFCLAAATVSLYVNPTQAWFMAFFGLLFPISLAANIIFLFFWLIVRMKYTLIPVIASILALPVMKNYVAFHFSKDPETAAGSVKVISYNVRNFDLYNWTQHGETMTTMMELILEEKPDIACFQEFFNADTGKYQTIKWLMEKAGFAYYRFDKTVTRKNYGSWGIATFSRFPIVGHGTVKFENSQFNSSVYADIKIDSAIIRVFNAHLQSVYFSEGDYEYIDHVAEEQDLQMKPTRRIISKLRQGFISRAPQALQLKQEIKSSPYPVIVCGDFNDTPASYCYRIISDELNDCFVKSGWGLAPSYSGFFSMYRIDYILADEKFEPRNYTTICNEYSDHYLIASEIALKQIP